MTGTFVPREELLYAYPADWPPRGRSKQHMLAGRHNSRGGGSRSSHAQLVDACRSVESMVHTVGASLWAELEVGGGGRLVCSLRLTQGSRMLPLVCLCVCVVTWRVQGKHGDLGKFGEPVKSLLTLLAKMKDIRTQQQQQQAPQQAPQQQSQSPQHHNQQQQQQQRQPQSPSPPQHLRGAADIDRELAEVQPG
jgi:hypothetical protein